MTMAYTKARTLTDADGDMVYEGTVMVTAEGDVADIAIEITAEDAAGNTGTGSVTVALDGTAPVITAEIDMSAVMTGGEATISATLSEASTVTWRSRHLLW
jgi:DNA-binding protein YbaB